MHSVGNCGTGFSGEQHEPRSMVARWRLGPNDSLGALAAGGRAEERIAVENEHPGSGTPRSAAGAAPRKAQR